MKIIDSHCHIHDANFPIPQEEVFENMQNSKISKAICIGENLENSKIGVKFAEENSSKIKLFAAIGVHPHEAEKYNPEELVYELEQLSKAPKVVAIGEIGLDYFYENSNREAQKQILKAQLKLAQKLNLPVSFHVRNAFEDFWPIFDEISKFGKIRGVLHSFTDSKDNLSKALKRDLFIGVNGISTFTKKPEDLEMFASIPLSKILIETDSPFLAPKGKRGKPNQPAFSKLIIEDLAEKRQISAEEVAKITTENCEKLFKI